jgi:hypothetical protein
VTSFRTAGRHLSPGEAKTGTVQRPERLVGDEFIPEAVQDHEVVRPGPDGAEERRLG